MNRTIQNALRLALSRRNYDFGGAAQPDEEDQEAFLKEQLKGSAPQYEPEAGFKTAKEAALMGAGFAPGAGLATAAGKFPTAEGGYEPSMKEDWREGRYGSAVMKGLGAAGDIVSAAPVVGTAMGTAMKAPLALKLATAMAPAARLAREAETAPISALTLYHGGANVPTSELHPLSFWTENKKAAETYMGEKYLEGEGKIHEMSVPLGKVASDQDVIDAAKEAGVYHDYVNANQYLSPEDSYGESYQKVAEILKNKGFNTAVMQDADMNMNPIKSYVRLSEPVAEAAPVAKAVEETPAYQRLINPAGFYSRAHEAAMLELPEGARTWQEMRSILAKRPGVKETELQWSGLHPEAFDPQQKITREEIAKRVEQNFPMVERMVKGQAPKEGEVSTQLALLREHGFEPEYAELPDGGRKWLIKDSEEGGHYTAAELSKLSGVDPKVAKAASSLERVAPLHAQYTVPGGENYSERVLTHQYTDPKLVSEHPDVREKYSKEYMSLFDEDMQISEQLDQRRRAGEYNTPEVKDLERREQENAAAMNKLRQKIFEESKALAPYQPEYTQSQFRHEAHLGDINNPILHTRNSERVGPNGERILHQEEVQSDWAQRGREKGFQNPLTAKEKTEQAELQKINRTTGLNSEQATRLDELEARSSNFGKGPTGVPRAPHVEDTEQWLDLAAKDTLSHAIENGFDKVFITGGQEQAKRWSNELRKAVDNVRWDTPTGQATERDLQHAIDIEAPRLHDEISRRQFGSPFDRLSDEDQYEVGMRAIALAQQRAGDKVKDLAGSKIVFAQPVGADQEHRFVVKPVEKNGKTRVEVVDSSIPSAKGETLSAVIGGDLAKRVMAEESGDVPMEGYRMGSEGYTQTYERKYPSSFKKLMKQLDPEAKVEAGTLAGDPKLRAEVDRIAQQNFARDWHELTPEEQERMRYKLGDAESSLSEVGGTYVNITPKMREKYFELKKKHGAVFPAYKDGGSVDSFLNASYNEPRKRFIDHALKVSRKHAK